MDTDSIIYLMKEEWYRPLLGGYLGEMTDEIWGEFKTEGAKMVSFTSCGPKNYGYLVKLPDGTYKPKIKTKGIKLSEEACKELDFNTMLSFSKSYVQNNPLSKDIPQQQFRADKFHNVYTVNMEKEHKVVSTKRRKIGNNTVSYGTK